MKYFGSVFILLLYLLPTAASAEAILVAVLQFGGNVPEEVRSNDQVLGRHSAGCAATYGIMEACDFKCTACYLADTANSTPPLPFEEVKQQLDAISRHLGPGGNTQITAGEVTLLPCDDLIRIIDYCRTLKLSPTKSMKKQNTRSWLI